MAKTPETEHPIKSFGYAAHDTTGVLTPFKFSRRATGEKDVRLKVLYCGICHSDLHSAKNDWGMTGYPIVPGHEVVGEVTEVGSGVGKFKVGEIVGVGCIVGSCHSCGSCQNDLEQYCPQQIQAYGFPYYDGTITRGGYSDHMVVDEQFVLRWPENLPLASGAPLLCAGITTYSPLRHYGLDKPGMNIGVVGLGGLGHVAVKMAKAFGAHVTVISTSPAKKQEAIEVLGAEKFLNSKDEQEMAAAAFSLHGIIDTVSASHQITPLINLLNLDGKLVMLGIPNSPVQLAAHTIIMGRRIVAGSAMGGLKETQEMLDFAAKHKIVADIEMVPIDYLNTAMERLAKGDVRYRFVIDVASSLTTEEGGTVAAAAAKEGGDVAAKGKVSCEKTKKSRCFRRCCHRDEAKASKPSRH